MKILIITTYPFPYGMAQTNRLIAIAKGLTHAKAKVKVIISKATEKPDRVLNVKISGTYEGIDYIYSSPGTIRPSSILKRIFWFLRALMNTFRLIAKENKSEKVDALFLGVTFHLNSFLFYLQTKFLGIKFIQERSEYPFLSYSKSIVGKFNLYIYLNLICRLFDGIIVISKSLESYFKPYLKSKYPVFLLPILVETERFSGVNTDAQNRIVYCGSMQGEKDGVPILIDAYNKIATQYPNIDLYLIGDTDFPGFKNLKAKIKSYNLESKIIFTGRIEREQIPGFLSSGKLLALARPYSKQSEGGFPTKLGEYLASGRTTIVTSVGDIPDYLTHKVNALLAIPGDVDNFAANLSFALENDKFAKEIGENGKKLALEVFDYKVQGIKLYEWLKLVCSNG